MAHLLARNLAGACNLGEELIEGNLEVVAFVDSLVALPLLEDTDTYYFIYYNSRIYFTN